MTRGVDVAVAAPARPMVALLAVIAVTLAAGAVAGQGAAPERAPPRIAALTVDADRGFEGDTFRFVATIDNPSGELVNFRWDFDDGTVVAGVTNLSAYRHRFRDDGRFTVRLEISSAGGATHARSVEVVVENVPPTIHRVTRSSDPLRGAAVTFTASVSDPGDDDLTFTWDFGDGSPPLVRRHARQVTHTYRSDGSYRLLLEVDDGDGGLARHEEVIVVGSGLRFVASGDAQGREGEDDLPAVTGLPVLRAADGSVEFRGDLGAVLRGEPPARGSGMCLVAVSSRGWSIAGGTESGLTLALTAVLPSVLSPGTYTIAPERIDLDPPPFRPWGKQFDAPGRFFAHLRDARIGPDDWDVVDYHGTGGTFAVHAFDGRRLEATFEITFEESLTALDLVETDAGPVLPAPRRAHVLGTLAHDLRLTMLGSGAAPGSLNIAAGAGFGDWYLCDSGEALQVVGHSLGPGLRAVAGERLFVENLPWERELYAEGDAVLEFTFDRPMISSSLHAGTAVLAVDQTTYAQTDPPAFHVPGTVVAVDDRTFRFVPDADLFDGVRYRMTLRGGSDGVRGASGEILDEDYSWTFATRVDLANVEAHVYQVARDAPLVPGKPTLTRVSVHWDPHPGVPPEAQLLDFPADITVEVDGEPAYRVKQGTRVRRPDTFDAEDRRQARTTTNFFGWRPEAVSSSRLVVTVEPSYQPQSEPARFVSEPLDLRILRHFGASPTITVDYYFMRIDSWRDGVPADWRSAWQRGMHESAAFATQNLPVAETIPRYVTDFGLVGRLWNAYYESRVALPRGEDGDRRGCLLKLPLPLLTFDDPEVTVLGAYADKLLAWDLYRATRRSDADVIVGIVPPEFGRDCDWGGVLVHFPPRYDTRLTDVSTPRVILLSADTSWAVLAHELGHFYGLCHTNDSDDGCVAHPIVETIEGFKIAPSGERGWSKSRIDGNAEGVSLSALMLDLGLFMDEPGRGLRTWFISNDNYLRLLENVPRRGIAGAATPSLAAASGAVTGTAGAAGSDPVIAVRGVVTADGAVAALEPLERLEVAPSAPSVAGPYRIELRDEAGTVLAVARFDTLAPTVTLHDTHEGHHHEPGPLPFEAVVPDHAAAHAVVLLHDERELARLERSRHPPQLELRRDGGEVTWRAWDADDDALVVDVHYSPDGWRWWPLAFDADAEDGFVVPPDLEPGPRPTVRVRVGDGFHETVGEVDVGDLVGLRVATVTAGPDEAVAPDDTFTVVFNAPLDALADGLRVRLIDEAGARVPASASLAGGYRWVRLTPVAPLRPGAYRLVVESARGLHGHQLAEPVEATFTVAAGEDALPASAAEAGTAVSAAIPPDCGGVPGELVLRLVGDRGRVVSVESDDGCRVEVEVPAALSIARGDLELALLGAGLVPTRNVQEGAEVIIEFRGPGLAGKGRLSAEATTVRLLLEVRP